MGILRAGVRPAFGVFVIAHGLAHAVLPLRGWMDPARPSLDVMLFILYSVAVLGFTIAGLGVLNIRPFTSLMRPVMVVASAYSLIAIGVSGQTGMFWGAAVDVTLLLTGLTAAYRFLPAAPPHGHGFWHAIGVGTGMAFVLYAAIAVTFWPLHRAWGSLPAEHALVLPGDSPDRNAAFELQHAVTVNAPPEQVWPWLVQLRQDRGWTVNEIQSNRAMVSPQWGAFVLEPTADGKTRFLIRNKVGDPHMPTWAAPLDMIAFELPHFIIERRMMLRIKSLAEANGKL